jgi:fatty acid desaturase
MLRSESALANSVADNATLPRLNVPAHARSWARQHAISQRRPRRAALMLIETGAWSVASVAFAEVVATWWAWSIAWISLVACIMRLDAIHHEAVHRSLFHGRFANDLVATVAGGLSGLHGPAYRGYHLAHHALTRRTGDPENLYDVTITEPRRFATITIPARVMYVVGIVSSGHVMAVQLVVYALTTMAGRPPPHVRGAALERHARRWAVVPFAFWVCLVGGAIATGHLGELVTWWIVPLLLFLSGPFAFFALAEHYGAPADEPALYSTGSVETNRLYRWLSLDGNYHLAHHVFPTASWWWLRAADQELRDDKTIHHRGYITFHRQVWADMGRRQAVVLD